MPSSDSPSSNPQVEPEVITPAAMARLEVLNLRQEAEEIRLKRLEDLANLMDAQFNVPILPVPIGVDAIIGLIPGIGDTISLGVSGYIIAIASRLGVPKRNLFQMGFNVFIDWLIGLIPIVGDLFDIGWRGNLRNTRITRAALEVRWAEEYHAALDDNSA